MKLIFSSIYRSGLRSESLTSMLFTKTTVRKSTAATILADAAFTPTDSEMTYTVLSGTLNHTQPTNHVDTNSVRQVEFTESKSSHTGIEITQWP